MTMRRVAAGVAPLDGENVDMQSDAAGNLLVGQAPTLVGALGGYGIVHNSGTMAAGLTSNSDIFQARWTHATALALVTEIIFDGLLGTATAFALGNAQIAAYVARAWTVDGSGGTTISLASNAGKVRTGYATSSFGSMRGSSTGALTGGTRTLDTLPMGQLLTIIDTTASKVHIPSGSVLYRYEPKNGSPLILAANEGIVVKATVPATGTWTWGLTFRWLELSRLPL